MKRCKVLIWVAPYIQVDREQILYWCQLLSNIEISDGYFFVKKKGFRKYGNIGEVEDSKKRLRSQ